MQAKLIEKLGTFDRGVKEANFQVIKNTIMPSVLVELGFLTNKEDAID
ncbi:N-acetylmuramoyl-L-alanine amidase [Anaerobacillus sp. HL2]|nr:N-acetylmuramoyl-L-alanine amidase [Anaerobacillus sp. HL2]